MSGVGCTVFNDFDQQYFDFCKERLSEGNIFHDDYTGQNPK